MNSDQNQNPSLASSLEGKIESFTGKFAIIVLTDGQKINWPLTALAEDLSVGQTVRIRLLTEADDQIQQEKLAKTILNEILK